MSINNAEEHDKVHEVRQHLNKFLNERDALVNERDALVNERDALVNERDALVNERDALVNERDALTREMDGTVHRVQTLEQYCSTLAASENIAKVILMIRSGLNPFEILNDK